MLMHPSTSSMFSEYGWEADTLGVRYRSGGKLFYHDGVSSETYVAFEEAEMNPDQSLGKFFHANIKKQYPGREIKEAPERDTGGHTLADGVSERHWDAGSKERIQAEMPVAPVPEEGP